MSQFLHPIAEYQLILIVISQSYLIDTDIVIISLVIAQFQHSFIQLSKYFRLVGNDMEEFDFKVRLLL